MRWTLGFARTIIDLRPIGVARMDIGAWLRGLIGQLLQNISVDFIAAKRSFMLRPASRSRSPKIQPSAVN